MSERSNHLWHLLLLLLSVVLVIETVFQGQSPLLLEQLPIIPDWEETIGTETANREGWFLVMEHSVVIVAAQTAEQDQEDRDYDQEADQEMHELPSPFADDMDVIVSVVQVVVDVVIALGHFFAYQQRFLSIESLGNASRKQVVLLALPTVVVSVQIETVDELALVNLVVGTCNEVAQSAIHSSLLNFSRVTIRFLIHITNFRIEVNLHIDHVYIIVNGTHIQYELASTGLALNNQWILFGLSIQYKVQGIGRTHAIGKSDVLDFGSVEYGYLGSHEVHIKLYVPT